VKLSLWLSLLAWVAALMLSYVALRMLLDTLAPILALFVGG